MIEIVIVVAVSVVIIVICAASLRYAFHLAFHTSA